MLWDDGLHLNNARAYKMGKVIFEGIFPRFLSQRRQGVGGLSSTILESKPLGGTRGRK